MPMLTYYQNARKNMWAKLKENFWGNHRIFITFTSVATCVLILRFAGLLQTWEWAALDLLFRLRPVSTDNNIIIVGIDESDLRQFAIGNALLEDRYLAQLLEKLALSKPRAIGLDLFRNKPIGSGQSELQKAFKSIPNLIGIERFPDKTSEIEDTIPGPAILTAANRVGFNNIPLDDDGKVRRSLLYAHIKDQKHTSFALKLALIYLAKIGIKPEPATSNPQYLQLGKATFQAFQPNDGAYVRADAGGYQIFCNFLGPVDTFKPISISDVLSGKVSSEVFRDRIVLIGSISPSLKDLFYIPYSQPDKITGVELHANYISQIIESAQFGRPLIKVWDKYLEIIWIGFWAFIGTNLSWIIRAPLKAVLTLILAGFSLTGICYLAFLNGWWIPLVPPLLTLLGSSFVITGFIAYLEEELKKSKEFLHTVINTIPDPVFVKDKEHRWIVLNEAYCKFVGYPLEKLIKKTDYDFFSKQESDLFWQQENLVFQDAQEHENEETFTDIQGITHIIETKRSLHKDAAGNLFLVGVIRDITERKRIEEELKKTAAELASSNADLRLAKDYLHHLAYHDTLTGLPNRKLFYERLIQSIERAYIHNQLVALLFLDLDGFKVINDTQGHNFGDLLLKAIASRLTGCLRNSDTVARLGGDEFTVILPGIPSKQDTIIVADKILTTITQPFLIEEQTISITISIGISLFPLDAENSDTLIKKADQAMYKAKEEGKNTYKFFIS